MVNMDKFEIPMISVCGSDRDDAQLSNLGLKIGQQIGELIAKKRVLLFVVDKVV